MLYFCAEPELRRSSSSTSPRNETRRCGDPDHSDCDWSASYDVFTLGSPSLSWPDSRHTCVRTQSNTVGGDLLRVGLQKTPMDVQKIIKKIVCLRSTRVVFNHVFGLNVRIVSNGGCVWTRKLSMNLFGCFVSNLVYIVKNTAP